MSFIVDLSATPCATCGRALEFRADPASPTVCCFEVRGDILHCRHNECAARDVQRETDRIKSGFCDAVPNDNLMMEIFQTTDYKYFLKEKAIVCDTTAISQIVAPEDFTRMTQHYGTLPMVLSFHVEGDQKEISLPGPYHGMNRQAIMVFDIQDVTSSRYVFHDWATVASKLNSSVFQRTPHIVNAVMFRDSALDEQARGCILVFVQHPMIDPANEHETRRLDLMNRKIMAVLPESWTCQPRCQLLQSMLVPNQFRLSAGGHPSASMFINMHDRSKFPFVVVSESERNSGLRLFRAPTGGPKSYYIPSIVHKSLMPATCTNLARRSPQEMDIMSCFHPTGLFFAAHE